MTSSPTATSTPTAQSDPRVPGWIGNPWVQGISAGLITLVPVRRYPEWLRQAAMWVPAAGVTAVLVTPRIWEAMAEADRRSISEQPPGQREQETESDAPPSAPDSEDGADSTNDPDSGREDLVAADDSEDLKPLPTMPRRIGRWAIGVAAGASVYGYMRFALWTDGAMEDKLREMGVRRPRIVLAVLGGLATGATSRTQAR